MDVRIGVGAEGAQAAAAGQGQGRLELLLGFGQRSLGQVRLHALRLEMGSDSPAGPAGAHHPCGAGGREHNVIDDARLDQCCGHAPGVGQAMCKRALDVVALACGQTRPTLKPSLQHPDQTRLGGGEPRQISQRRVVQLRAARRRASGLGRLSHGGQDATQPLPPEGRAVRRGRDGWVAIRAPTAARALTSAPGSDHCRSFAMEAQRVIVGRQPRFHYRGARLVMISALMPTYNRADLAFERGEGAWLFTADGRRFLDFGAGIATSSLGHAHPHLVKAIADQAGRVMHTSNLYRVPQAERLAARFVEATFADSVFFCNSGAEANEGMVKMMRKAMSETGHSERYRVICFDGAFHGRTLAMLAATGNAKYLKGFGPEVDGFDHVPFNNMNAVRNAIGPQTAGILVEPVQGEGGIRPADLGFLRDLRATCDEFGLILGLDEVQCGMGRTGKLFAHEWAGIEPDVISIAKGVAGGFPMGAILAKESVAKHLSAGTHGTTFGGNPLACAAANAVLDVILAPGFLEEVDLKARRLWHSLEDLVREYPSVLADVRGAGLILGLKAVVPNSELQDAFMAEGLLTVAAGDNVVRLVPPLNLTDADIDAALGMMRRGVRRCLPSSNQVAAK